MLSNHVMSPSEGPAEKNAVHMPLTVIESIAAAATAGTSAWLACLLGLLGLLAPP
jgi:hypothetical protein